MGCKPQCLVSKSDNPPQLPPVSPVVLQQFQVASSLQAFRASTVHCPQAEPEAFLTALCQCWVSLVVASVIRSASHTIQTSLEVSGFLCRVGRCPRRAGQLVLGVQKTGFDFDEGPSGTLENREQGCTCWNNLWGAATKLWKHAVTEFNFLALRECDSVTSWSVLNFKCEMPQLPAQTSLRFTYHFARKSTWASSWILQTSQIHQQFLHPVWSSVTWLLAKFWFRQFWFGFVLGFNK